MRPDSLQLGDHGSEVLRLREQLADLGLLDSVDSMELVAAGAAGADSEIFAADVEHAVRAFQQQRGLTVDGVVGAATRRALADAARRLGDRLLRYSPPGYQSGDDVLAVQRRLIAMGFAAGRVDGLYGENTAAAVAELQRNLGLEADGVCGPQTLAALARLRPMVHGGDPNAMRAQERLRRAGPHLDDKLFVVDVVPSEVRGVLDDPELQRLGEDVLEDIATRIESALVGAGARTRRTDPGDEHERAQAANRSGAQLCLSFTVESSVSPAVNGVSTYYYGIDAQDIRSTAGERFAGLVQREIVARTGAADLRSHARFWDMLRLTRMPAVRIDLGYLTNPDDASRMRSEEFREAVTQAVVVAVQRVYLTPDTDPPTGVLRVDELRDYLDRGD